MIVKEHPIPISIKMHEALLRRLPVNHPSYKKVQQNLTLAKKGLRGEKAIDYFLGYLPEKEYFILHDLTLFVNNHSFQMDTLILTPNFFLILEVKNYDGTVVFDDKFKQLIRIVDGVEEGYPNPITQVERHQSQLQHWLTQKGLHQIPIETMIVFGYSATIIKTTSNNQEFIKHIIHSENIPEAVSKIAERNHTRHLSKNELQKLAKLMLKNNRPQTPNLLEKYEIDLEDIEKGVHCPK